MNKRQRKLAKNRRRKLMRIAHECNCGRFVKNVVLKGALNAGIRFGGDIYMYSKRGIIHAPNESSQKSPHFQDYLDDDAR